ncbi:MAG TPA: hypothetical protein VNH45_04180 [Gaiellaceae bacterium]|nr:hypothetical protein [Gaiellaceae bacterium]
MLRVALAAVVAGLFVVPASAAPLALGFRVSNAVACVVDKGAVRCDVRGTLSPKPTAACTSRWRGVSLRSTGRPQVVCDRTTVFSTRLPTVATGSAYAFPGGITCLVKASGASCSNNARHGFTLTPTRWTRH